MYVTCGGSGGLSKGTGTTGQTKVLVSINGKLPTELMAPPVAPTFKVVLAPPKLMVPVAPVFNRSKLVLPDIRLVVRVGLVPKTATPVPVSSLRPLSKAALVPVDTKFLEPSVKTA